jgi:hypothetical protein
VQRSRHCEVVEAIVEADEQTSSRVVEDDSRTITVLGELKGCRLQVDARAAQHCD